MRSSLLSGGQNRLPMKNAPTFRAGADNVRGISLCTSFGYFSAFL